MGEIPGRFRRWLQHLQGVPIDYELRPYQEALGAINAARVALEEEPDELLREQFVRLRATAREGTALQALQIPCYALICEAARRELGLRPFDVQVIAALGLHQGRVVEMATGEGKTLAAVLPACLNALTGEGVHILTFNDYLARRDATWMGPVYRFFGLTVGAIQEDMAPRARHEAYGADVTYSTAKQAGFDFLRSTLRWSSAEQIQRPFHFAIVDEADSILIDEARIPMIIAGRLAGEVRNPQRLAALARALEPAHYEVEPHARTVYLTEEGIRWAESALGLHEGLHAPDNLPLLTELNLAVHAAVLLRRDVDYLVRQERIEPVDELTGRVVEDRQWPDGLQAAIEAKEGLRTQPDGQVLNSITVQHFMQRYPRVCGMTATAQRGAEEFHEFYGMRVLVLPPHQPSVREDHPDLIYPSRQAKLEALVDEIAREHATGRPILIGTASVEESERLAAALAEHDLPCDVLNAKTDEREAEIIADAGRLGAITVSTNMAGRGTDIRLGGHDGAEHAAVAALGGLYVIGTNRHESRRTDDQLRGRAGRQGDPGATRFFISVQDELMVRYGLGAYLAPELPTDSFEEPGAPIEDPAVGRIIARVQRQVEGQSFDIRATLWKYSAVIEDHRQLTQRWRDSLFDSDYESLLERETPARYAEVLARAGRARLREIERQLTLYHLDRGWSDYLEQVKDIQDASQLVGVAAERPLDQFRKRATAAFEHMLGQAERSVVERFEQATLTTEGIDLEREGLQRPASTWTYLVNDTLFGEYRDLVLGNMAFAAGAALATGPLVFAFGWLKRRQHRRRAKG